VIHVQATDTNGCSSVRPLRLTLCHGTCSTFIAGTCPPNRSPGDVSTGIESIDNGTAVSEGISISIGLGQQDPYNGAGHLYIVAGRPYSTMWLPYKISYPFGYTGVRNVAEANEMLDYHLQWQAPAVVADVSEVTGTSYTIRLYDSSAVDEESTNASGVVTFDDSPFKTIVIDKPGSDTNELRVTTIVGGTSNSVTYTFLTNGIQLERQGGRVDRATTDLSETNTVRTVTRTVEDNVASVFQSTIEV